MEIFSLGEGSYSVDASKKFIPFDPQTDNPKDRPASLFIHVNPFLIKTDTDLLLLDTGLGFKDTRDELFLHQHIRNAGFDPEDVTQVLMSHLHYDHSGGLVVERVGALLVLVRCQGRRPVDKEVQRGRKLVEPELRRLRGQRIRAQQGTGPGR